MKILRYAFPGMIRTEVFYMNYMIERLTGEFGKEKECNSKRNSENCPNILSTEMRI